MMRALRVRQTYDHRLRDAIAATGNADLFAAVRRLVAFYVGEHNEKIPRALLGGRTPDEVYFGPGGESARALLRATQESAAGQERDESSTELPSLRIFTRGSRCADCRQTTGSSKTCSQLSMRSV